MQETGSPGDHWQHPEPQEVRGELARILTSPDFSVPERLRGFLTFVVEEFLAGRGDRIKAYSIATHVFGRAQDFDVQNDPVVRIEAGRLRRALERYYLTGGRTDPVVIDIPKGGYAPEIRRRDRGAEPTPVVPAEPIPELPAVHHTQDRTWNYGFRIVAIAMGAVLLLAIALRWGLAERSWPTETAGPEVTLVVTPFVNLSGQGGEIYSAGISEELLSQLARFRELKVLGRDTARLIQQEQGGQQPSGVQYLLGGSVRTADHRLRVTSRLLSGRTGEILWSQIYERDLRGAGNFEIESDIAAKVAAAVAQPYGAIFTPVSRDSAAQAPGNTDSYLCVLRFYHYRRVLDRDEHRPTRDCLERLTEGHPSYSTGWAMLAHLYLDEDRYDLNRRTQAPSGFLRAREAAERAVALDPSNVRGLQALMTVLFFSRQPEAALEIGEKALALNPNDTEVLAELGSRVAQAGDWKRGATMIDEALARNPNLAGYHGLAALAYYMLGDDARAVESIRRADQKRFSLYHLVAALIFSRAGLEQEARGSVVAFLKMRPLFFHDFDAELAMRNFNAKDRLVLIEGARRAGFPVGTLSR